MAPMSLPPGFRFHPTDEELVAYYLDRKITGHTIELEIIPEVDLYKCEPWDLPDKSFLPGKDMEWYFYSPRDRKYPNGSRTNRATKAGYWKATGKDRLVQSQKRVVGMKKTLVYYRGRAPHGIRTNWVMHEYRLLHSLCGIVSSTLKDSYALCRIFKKTMQISKRKLEENNGKPNSTEIYQDIQKESTCVSNEHIIGDNDGSGINNEIYLNEDHNIYYPNKFPSDTSSSDLTQGTPTETGIVDDIQATPNFANCDEANSDTHLYSSGLDCYSTLIQDIEMANYGSLEYQLSYPPLEMKDFPQMNLAETMKIWKPEMEEQYLMISSYEKFRDYINGTYEEIFSLCSTHQPPQQNSNTNNQISMQE